MEDAHREEIKEALWASVFDNDPESFSAFYEEWQRIDGPNEDRAMQRFDHPPRHYHAEGMCPHCGYGFSTTGVDFTGGKLVKEMTQQLHLFYRCTMPENCRCFVGDESEMWERCIRCDLGDEFCECPEGTQYGPCHSPFIEVTWLEPVE